MILQPALFIFALLFGILYSTTASAIDMQETSGVARVGDKLLFVSDDNKSIYFETTLNSKQLHIKEGFLQLDASQIRRVSIPGGHLAIDLESIDDLADGGIAVLSEQLGALLTMDGSILEYDARLSEMGNRGLEGLAIRPLANNTSRIAALWEGGYPVKHDLPRQFPKKAASKAFCPVVLIHDHEPGSNIKYITPWKTAAKDIFLHVPALNEQRFRAPDIVWNSWMVNGVKKWGFIVLISSANPALPRKERYKFQWLLRFDGNGNPYGEPIDIASLVPKDFKTTNWEGLDWYEEGKKLILVYDDKKEKLPNPLVVDVSKHWDMNEIPSQKILRPDADSCK